MTQDEFLDRFCDRMGISRHYRTPDGVEYGSFRRVAVRCEQANYEHTHYLGSKLGSVACDGWVLIEPPKNSYRGGEYKVTDHRS